MIYFDWSKTTKNSQEQRMNSRRQQRTQFEEARISAAENNRAGCFSCVLSAISSGRLRSAALSYRAAYDMHADAYM
jgi:hypothetical protein